MHPDVRAGFGFAYAILLTKELYSPSFLLPGTTLKQVLDRDQKIGDLEDKSEELMHGSKQFRRSAVTLKNKMWCQNKMWCIGLFVVLAVIGGIVAGTIIHHKNHSPNNTYTQP